MPRIDLNVPYKEKDDAKRLGAKWDPTKKVWFVPDGADPTPFAKWQNPAEEDEGGANIRSAAYFIAEARRQCWKCGQETSVFGFMLPEGFESLYVGDVPEEDEWGGHDEPTVLSFVTELCEQAVTAMRVLTTKYRLSFSKSAGSSYWVNHCQHCDALQGDFETIEEFDAPLNPAFPESAAKILLREHHEPFEARCGTIVEAGFDLMDYMQRAKLDKGDGQDQQ